MRSAAAVALLFAAAGVAAAQFQTMPTVDATLAAWQKATGVPIDPEALQRIRSDVGNAEPRLAELEQLQSRYEPSPAPLLRMLVRSYCFDLRDRKLGGTRRPLAFARPFQPGQSLRIGTADVARFSFLDYLAQFFPRLNAVGYLEVSSRPDQATIAIDNQPKGFTDRVFVTSPGTHSVVVSSADSHLLCRRKLRVDPGRKATMACR